MSLTNQDKKDISELINNALVKFYEELIRPSFEVIFEKFEQMEKKQKEHDQRFDRLERTLDIVAEKVTSHEKRIHTLEIASQTS